MAARRRLLANLTSRRLAARQWSCSRHLRQPLARLLGAAASAARTPSYNRRLSDGSGYPFGHGAVDTRICVPDSIPRCLASCNSTPLIACHVSASIAPTCALRTPTSSSHGTDRPVQRCTEAESSSASNPRAVAHQMHETAQRRMVSQVRPTQQVEPVRRCRSCRAVRGVESSHAELRAPRRRPDGQEIRWAARCVSYASPPVFRRCGLLRTMITETPFLCPPMQ